MIAARNEARKNFENNRHRPADSEETLAGIAHAEEVAGILRHNIVQGQEASQGGSGNYSMLRRNHYHRRGVNVVGQNFEYMTILSGATTRVLRKVD